MMRSKSMICTLAGAAAFSSRWQKQRPDLTILNVTCTVLFVATNTITGRLAGKNILITGGNSGIGLATAQEFDKQGARVAICGLNEGTLQATKKTLGAGSLAVRADVSNLTDLDTMVTTIKPGFRQP